ncbi:MAG: beta-ketoacyl-[acyl-carrier-protein] synthase family protein [Pirellulales bacterium]|nr:beta-ketoacyl-[acyl-carrier-protein] synthase family protein [Pirellulales bacterium]
MTQAARRVVVTGVGFVSPLGNTKESLWESLSSGRSGVALLDCPDAGSLPVGFGAAARQFTGEIDDFGLLPKEQKKAIRKGLKVMCRECQMGVAAAQMALADAGLGCGQTDPDRSGVVFGMDYLLSDPEEFFEGVQYCRDEHGRFQYSRWGSDGLAKMSPLWLLKYLPNMPASHLAIYNDFRGPNNSLTMRESAADAALGEAYRIIRRGDADAMLVGATGSRLHPMKMIHALGQEEVAAGDGDPTAMSRPFDRDRRGMVLGEGAGVVVVEELAVAEAHGATIYGEVIAAAGSSVVGRRLLARRGRAMQNALEAVLRNAGAGPDDVGHLQAHGLGSRSGDAEEAAAVRQVFAGRKTPLPVTAAKSYFGNLGAGAGAVELIAGLLSLRHDRLYPILNYETPDPDCPISAARAGGATPGDSFIHHSVTPQGQAAAVMLRKIA